jgi:hypothetical protein
MQSSSGTNGFESLVLFGLILASAILVRKGRLDPAAQSLERRQRIRPLPLEWLDPLIAVVLIGSTLWDTVFTSLTHVGVALLGAAIGVPIGLARARVVFVRALPSSKSVVLTRSTAEYLLLALLLCLRLGGSTIARSHSKAGLYVLGALLGLAVAESVARSVAITLRYRNSANEIGPRS